MANKRIETDIIANDKASHVYKQVGSNLQGMAGNFNRGISSINSSLHKYNTAMNSLTRSTQIAMAASGYFVYKFTSDSIKQFADLEREHGKTMGAMANNYDKATASQQKFYQDQIKLKQQALKLGTTGPNDKGTLYNPTEVAYAQTQLIKAGKTAKDIGGTGVVPSVLKFAGGNDLPLDTATEYAVNIAEMFQIPTSKWGDMLDKITRTADISTIDVPDLFESLKYTGGIASGLNRPLEEILGMIALMGNAGLKGSMSGTGIQAMFTRMLSPVGKSAKTLDQAPTEYSENMFKAFYNDVTDSKGNFKPMTEVTDLLDKAMGSLNDREQAWFAQKLFGLFQMKAGYALTRSGKEGLEDTINTIKTTSAGTNDNKWEIMLNNAWGRQEAFENMIQGLKTDVGYRLQPVTTSVYNELFSLLSKKGDYSINYAALEESIKQSGSMFAEQYGEQIGKLVENAGKLGLNGSRILGANEPLAEGVGVFITKLLGGDLLGGVEEMGKSIGRANDRINDLPPNLQTMAREVRNVVLALATLSGINMAAKVAENITTLWKYTIGRVSASSATDKLKNSMSNITSEIMNVKAATVYITSGMTSGGGGMMPKEEGAPIVSKTKANGVAKTSQELADDVRKAESKVFVKDRNGNLVEDMSKTGVQVGLGERVQVGDQRINQLETEMRSNQAKLEAQLSSSKGYLTTMEKFESKYGKNGENKPLNPKHLDLDGMAQQQKVQAKMEYDQYLKDYYNYDSAKTSFTKYSQPNIEKLQNTQAELAKKLDSVKAEIAVAPMKQQPVPSAKVPSAEPNPTTEQVMMSNAKNNEYAEQKAKSKSGTSVANAVAQEEEQIVSKKPGIIGGMGNKLGNALMLYSILSALGIPQFAMDKVGLTNGTSGRDTANKVDTALQWAGVAAFVESQFGVLRKSGAIIRRAVPSVVSGMSTLGSYFMELSTAVGGATAGGTAVGGVLVAAPLAVGALAGADAIADENRSKEIDKTISDTEKNGGMWYWDDTKTNRNVLQPWNKPNPIISYSKEQMDNAKYKYGGSLISSGYIIPDKPDYKWWYSIMGEPQEYKVAMERYKQASAKASSDTAYDSQLFASAQMLYQKRNNGKMLTWQEYNSNREQWKNDKSINKDGSINTNTGEIMTMKQIQSSIAQTNDWMSRMMGSMVSQPQPNVNVGAPSVTVNVTVDQNGKIVKQDSFINQNSYITFDEAYKIHQSRLGGGK